MPTTEVEDATVEAHFRQRAVSFLDWNGGEIEETRCCWGSFLFTQSHSLSLLAWECLYEGIRKCIM
jgi:hypothetical protein